MRAWRYSATCSNWPIVLRRVVQLDGDYALYFWQSGKGKRNIVQDKGQF